jgi:hypothetical protein
MKEAKKVAAERGLNVTFFGGGLRGLFCRVLVGLNLSVQRVENLRYCRILRALGQDRLQLLSRHGVPSFYTSLTS